MTGPEFFKFSNGKEFKFSDLQQNPQSSSFSDSKLKQIFNIFDTDNSGTIDAYNSRGEDEVLSIWNKLKNAASKNGDNYTLDDEELRAFALNNLGVRTNVTVDDIKNFIQNIFTPKQKTETYQDNKVEYSAETIKENAKNTLTDNVARSFELFHGQNQSQGDVSKLFNQFKENFNTEFAASRVNRYLLTEDYASTLINQADSDTGLTKRDYCMAKIDLLSKLIPEITHKRISGQLSQGGRLLSGNLIQIAFALGFDDTEGLSDEELQNLCEMELLKQAIMRLPLSSIDRLITTLTNLPDEQYASFESDELNNALDEVINNFTNIPSGEAPAAKNMSPVKGSAGEMIFSDSASEKMTFEETFLAERGVEYDKNLIENYATKEAYLQYIVSVNNRTQELKQKISKHLEQLYNMDQTGMTSPQQKRIIYDALQKELTRILNTLYQGDNTKIQQVLDELTNGAVKINSNSLEGAPEDFVLLAQRFIEKNNNTMEKLLNGKTLDDYSNEAQKAYKLAYGSKNSINLAEEYVKSQQEGVQNIKIGVQTGGMVLMICGQLVPVVGQLGGTIIGTSLATLGGVGISAAENYTKAGGPTEEDKKAMLEELTTSLALFAAGTGIGKMSENVFRALVIKNCPKLVAFASEIGVDATCSLLADLAITGQIDISGEGIAQLQNILTGIILSKGSFKNYLNTHAGVNRVSQAEAETSDVTNAGGNKASLPMATAYNKTDGVFADLKYSKKSIRDLIESNSDLKNNQWVQENLDKLLNACSENTKIQHPLLTSHRLKILNTFFSNPALYKNESLQQEIKRIIVETQNANEAKNIVKSLQHYANYPNKNQTVNLFAPDIITNRYLSLENKQKLYDYLAEDGKNIYYFNENIARLVSDEYFDIVMEILQKKTFYSVRIANLFLPEIMGKNIVSARKEMYELIKNDEEISSYDKEKLLGIINETNIDFAKKYYKTTDLDDDFVNILSTITNERQGFAEMLIEDKNFPNELIAETLTNINKYNIDFAKEIYSNLEVPREYMPAILYNVNSYRKDFARILVSDKNFPKDKIANLLNCYNPETKDLIKTLYNDKSIAREDIAKIVSYRTSESCDIIKEVYAKLKAEKNFPDEYISKVLMSIDYEVPSANKDYALELCREYKQLKISPDKLDFLIKNYDTISPRDLQKLYRVMGNDKVSKLSESDLIMACQMVDIYGKTSLNEIPIEGKKNLLRRLISCNEGLFRISDEIKKDFPLIPTDRDTYCSLLPSIVKSLGVDIRTIEPPSRIREFNSNLENLSGSLAKLSDNDFAQMEIKLDYPKDEFITDVLAKVKDLTPNERQKVYDYFGFELHENKNNQTGFSIIGYPINLNNGKKLAEITDPKTKAVVESLRADVVRFSEQNPIKCNKPEVQQLLNDIVDVLPELRTQIGKEQHKTHDYDVFKHSLKVLQKVAQDPKFQALNESDKKIMMLASLLHDITKGEGFSDKTHAAQGSFDTFFISKKFNLTPEEEIKLYTLTRHHEWLEYVNTSKSKEQLTKRLQSVAYDLQHDNLFDMALMFTHADLRAVKKDDSFHDTKVGGSRIDFRGKVRSFGESADFYAKRIRGYIDELKTTQPILPVTRIPKTNRINEAITHVNADGSTNIKGVYKRRDGLVVIKFNEVEDWELIGFPKGSVSRGYEAKAGSKAADGEFEENVNTGNIKFFVHGLDYENQLAKFDAFSLIDSDVLLSVSYAERPESKFRFFRTQGVLLDFDTKYIHGGGNTDAGSGCGKFIEDFKRNYIFGGCRESDRVYVPNLIKNATGMNDAEYVKFVEANKNRPLTEIEPAEYREAIIKALASINSNTRKGGRSYNEMYGSNPKEVMGVFAYDSKTPSNVGNPLDFLETTFNKTDFLQKYALEHDIPFIVFGD